MKRLPTVNEELMKRDWHVKFWIFFNPELGSRLSICTECLNIQNDIRVDGDQHNMHAMDEFEFDAGDFRVFCFILESTSSHVTGVAISRAAGTRNIHDETEFVKHFFLSRLLSRFDFRFIIASRDSPFVDSFLVREMIYTVK